MSVKINAENLYYKELNDLVRKTTDSNVILENVIGQRYIGGGTAKGKPVENGALPIVAINTTAGTGSEIDPWAVTTNEETNEKIGWGIEDCFAKIVIEDP